MGIPQKRVLDNGAFFSGRGGDYVCLCSSRVEELLSQAACVRSPWFHRLISRGRIIIYFQSRPSRKLASRSRLKALTGQRSSSVLDAEENSRRERTQRTMSKRRPYVESVTSFSVFPATRIYTSVFIIVQVAKMLAIDDESG